MTQLALPGVSAVDPRRAEWRAHTAERWQAEDPESYAECIEAVRRGELNKSRLAAKFARSRNSILALTMREFTVEQLQAINGKRAAIVVGESMERMDDLMEHAGVDHLGSLSMAAKQASDIAQVTSGGPTEIREERLVLTVEDFTALVGTGLEGGEMSAMRPRSGPVIEAETAPERDQGNKLPLPESTLTRSPSIVERAVMLAFMLVVGALTARAQGGEGVPFSPRAACVFIGSVT